MSSARDGARSSTGRRGLALAACSLGFAVVQLDVSIVNVALPSIGRELSGSTSSLQWVVDAYTVVFAAFILTAGSLGDRFGVRRLVVIGFLVFTVASAGCALAPTLRLLLLARSVQGIGATCLLPGSLALLRHSYDDDDERARAVGIWSAGASVGLSAGPLLGGLLTSAFGWRAVFFVNLPLGAVGLLLVLMTSSETVGAPHRPLDVVGTTSIAGSLALLSAGVIEGGRTSFALPSIGGLVIGGVALVVFVAVEHRSQEPMLPLGLFGSSTFSSTVSVGFLANVAFYGMVFVLSLFFQNARGLGPLLTGLAFAPMTASILVTNLLAARWVRRFGAGRVMFVGGLIMAAGFAGLIGADVSADYVVLAIPLAAAGAGLGTIVPPMTSSTLADVPVEKAGVASGALNSSRQTGSVFGIAVLGALATGNATAGVRVDSWIAVFLGVAVAALSLFTRDVGRSRT